MKNMNYSIRILFGTIVAAICFVLCTGCAGATDSPPASKPGAGAGTSSVPTNGPTVQSHPFGPPGRLNSIGHCTPDRVYDIDPEVDAADAVAQTLKTLQAIDAKDMLLVEELREGYEEKTVAEFRAAFNRQAEKSRGFISAVSELSYAGIHDIYMDMDDYYCSLYFALLDWYKNYGPESIQDVSYSFSYWRYLGEKHEVYTTDNYYILKVVYVGYSMDIIYSDDTSLTVGERDSAIAGLSDAINGALYEITPDRWSDADVENMLYDLLQKTMKSNSNDDITFELLQIDFVSGALFPA